MYIYICLASVRAHLLRRRLNATVFRWRTPQTRDPAVFRRHLGHGNDHTLIPKQSLWIGASRGEFPTHFTLIAKLEF